MRCVILQEFRRKGQVVVDGQWATVGFSVEFSIEMPFAPFVGLRVDAPSKSPDHDPYFLKITDVLWDVERDAFLCDAEDFVGYDAALVEGEDGGLRPRPATLAESYLQLLEDAALAEADGWRVARRALCMGRWQGEDGKLITTQGSNDAKL